MGEFSDGDVQGVIDWSSAKGGFAEEDFCPLEFGGWSNNSSYKEAFLEGYAPIRKVPEYGYMMSLLRLSYSEAWNLGRQGSQNLSI